MPTTGSQTDIFYFFAQRLPIRWAKLSLWICLFMCLLPILALAQTNRPLSEDQFSILPVPAWVKPIQVESSNVLVSAESSAESRELLFDKQVNVQTEERFLHIARQILNESGVQNYSRLSFYFDPTYQHLTLHSIRINRAGDSLDRLDSKKIKIIQQEKDLSRHLYDGSLSAILFLEDVRVGDIIEYAFTVRGFNPVFNGRYTDSFMAQWSVPLDRQFVRILARKGGQLAIRSYTTDRPPTVSKSDPTEYVWDIKKLPALVQDDSLPIWFDPYPWVQLTEFRDWTEVASWGLTMYGPPSELSAELRGLVAKWKEENSKPEDRLLAALRFVQDEIRYLGIELGPNSHQPTDPNIVCARRFGDCKDKTFLLCTLLAALKIDAAPAFVNTTSRHTIAEWLPCSTAFNHVVTEVRVGPMVYWVDPTRSNQRGPLSTRYFPNYGRALLIRPGVTDLTTIPQQTNGLPNTTVQETFVVKNRKDPVDFTIVTIAEGVDADNLRGDLAEQRQDELEKTYLNFYARYYPGVESVRSMEVVDRPEQNIIQTTEYYRIKEFWVLSDDKKTYECEFYPATIGSFLRIPDTSVRSMSLGFSHPRRQTFRTEVRLPESWPIENEKETVADPAFKLTAHRTYQTNNLVMEYNFESLSDAVSVQELPRHLKNLQRARGTLGYSLTWPNDEVAAAGWNPNWMLMALGGIFLIPLGIGTGFVYRLASRNGPPAPVRTVSEPLEGLGGWLILIAIGLVTSPFYLLHGIYESRELYSLDLWHMVTIPSSESYHALWAPLIVINLLGSLTMIILVILTMALFFRRRRLFPPVYICFLLLNAILLSIDYFGSQMIPMIAAVADGESMRDLTRSYVGCAIWIPYMLVSRRVKLTFRN